MKLDKDFVPMGYCPGTNKRMTYNEHSNNNGICPRCGDVQRGTFTHIEIKSGKWLRPNIFEWLCGKRKQFISKDKLCTYTPKIPV